MGKTVVLSTLLITCISPLQMEKNLHRLTQTCERININILTCKILTLICNKSTRKRKSKDVT